MAADYLMGVTKSDPDRFRRSRSSIPNTSPLWSVPNSTIQTGADLSGAPGHNAPARHIALSTSLGNSNHVAVAKVVRHAGADTEAPNMRVFDTALDAVADVVAGHADSARSRPQVRCRRSRPGRLRDARHLVAGAAARVYAEAPTWMEQGVDCVMGSWRGASGPPGLGDEQISFWRGVLAKATATPEWKGDLARLFWIRDVSRWPSVARLSHP